MTGDAKARDDTRCDFDWFSAVAYWMNQSKRGFGVFFSVKRQRWSVFSQLMTVTIVGIFLLKSSSVRQKNLKQVGGATRAVNWTMKAVANKTGKIAGMIDMCVCYQNCI